MELNLPFELVPNLNRIAHRIELELELLPKNHQNPSPDSDPALELIQPYSPLTETPPVGHDEVAALGHHRPQPRVEEDPRDGVPLPLGLN